MAVYSEDLRVKVVEFLKKGHTIKETAETFGVSMRSVSIWKKMDKEIPSLESIVKSQFRIKSRRIFKHTEQNTHQFTHNSYDNDFWSFAFFL